MRIVFILAVFSGSFVACGGDSSKVDLPRIPIDAIPLADTSTKKIVHIDTMPTIIDTVVIDSSRPKRLEKPNLLPAKISFKDSVFNFGTIKADSVVTHVFEFVNSGGKPLEISSVIASCGCTAASYPFLPISKAEKSSITAKFDSKGKSGRQEKTLTVFSNAENSPHTLVVKGIVSTAENGK